uniref:6-phosphofructo-2-kinase domain-containing protein n=1 Tax=Romanomermis culicivorax TaxID=13658 RepID=A0A915IA21_ROMCU
MDREKAKNDFIQRIDHYRMQYEPLDPSEDAGMSFIKVFNAGRSFLVQHITGHVQSRVHGESEYNRLGRIGGDSPLSERGIAYAKSLAAYFSKNAVSDLRVWTSQKIRAVQTANRLKNAASYVEYWKALDELDAGICEGLTYDEIKERYPEQFAHRDQEKYHYRYPSGE